MWKVSQFVSAMAAPHGTEILSPSPGTDKWIMMSQTHERGQMQDSFSADMKDQLNENGSFPSKPQMVNEGRVRKNPIPWPVSLSAGGPLNRASVTRLVATRVRGLLAERH